MEIQTFCCTFSTGPRFSCGGRCGVVAEKRTESLPTDKWPHTVITSTCMPVPRDALPAHLFPPPWDMSVWTQITSPRSVKYATADTLCFTFCIFIMHLLQRLAAGALLFITSRDLHKHLIKNKKTYEAHLCSTTGCLNPAQSSKQIVPHRRIGWQRARTVPDWQFFPLHSVALTRNLTLQHNCPAERSMLHLTYLDDLDPFGKVAHKSSAAGSLT